MLSTDKQTQTDRQANATKNLTACAKEVLSVNLLLRAWRKKAPGLDGICIEFYQKFWLLLGNLLVDVFNQCFDDRKLTMSQRTATGKKSCIYSSLQSKTK